LLAVQTTQLLFVLSNAFSQCLQRHSQMTDLGQNLREAPRIVTSLPVFFHECPKGLISIERRPAYLDAFDNVGKAHWL
jgi:hypothetical protein